MSEKIFKIAGMDCAEETNALRQAVGALPGILDLRFNLLDGAMTVTAPEGAVDERDIVAAMERAGMSARPLGVVEITPERTRVEPIVNEQALTLAEPVSQQQLSQAASHLNGLLAGLPVEAIFSLSVHSNALEQDVLADDDFLQFVLHQPPVVAEFL